uniref:Uncharacterized protein n=1 Tax=viral metagenome TaxID=1070528 RepID=A0A6M3KYC1_9ZZZZ
MTLIECKEEAINIISVGITFCDGRAIFKKEKKWSMAYYGICHYSDSVFMLAAIDWPKSKMFTTIHVSPLEKYCEQAHICLDFKCLMNRFDKGIYTKQYDCGALSLGLPLGLNKDTPLWFNEGKWRGYWGKLLAAYKTKPNGGVINFKPTDEYLATHNAVYNTPDNDNVEVGDETRE